MEKRFLPEPPARGCGLRLFSKGDCCMKAANRNLLLFGIPALLLLVLGASLLFIGNTLLEAVSEAAPSLPQGEVGDVEGYAFLIQFIGTGFGGLAGIMVQVMGLLLLFYGGGVLFFTLLARLIYRTRPGRILAYRILMGIALFVTLLPAPELFSLFVRSLFQGSFSPGILVCLVLLAVLGVLGCQNTYTSRILEGAPEAPSPREA